VILLYISFTIVTLTLVRNICRCRIRLELKDPTGGVFITLFNKEVEEILEVPSLEIEKKWISGTKKIILMLYKAMILNTCLPKIKTRKEKAYWIFLILLQEDGFTKIAKIFGRAQDKSCKFTIKYTDRDFLYGSKGSYTAHTIDWAPRGYTFQQPVLPEPEVEAD